MKKNMEKIEKLTSSELKIVLKWLKLYEDLTKKLWNRGKSIFNKKLSWEKSYRVQYSSSMTEDNVWDLVKDAFLKSFWDEPDRKNVVFSKNDSFFWGVKIFRNDSMVDLSLSKAINQIK